MATLLQQAEAHGVTPPSAQTLKKYGLTVNAWIRILRAQGWVCPICQRARGRWNTDHDHAPGWAKMPAKQRATYVRGILCWYCNHRRVNSRMSADEAQRIADYLAAYEERRNGGLRPH